MGLEAYEVKLNRKETDYGGVGRAMGSTRVYSGVSKGRKVCVKGIMCENDKGEEWD